MPALWNLIKKSKVVITIIIILIIGYLIYFYVYFAKITDNAYVVANTRSVAAEVPGIIDQVNVKNGEFVKKGALLFSLRSSLYQYRYEEALAALNAAKAQLSETKQKIAILINDVNTSEKSLALAKERYEGDKTLYEQNLSAKLVYHESRNQYYKAQNALDNAKEQLTAANIAKARSEFQLDEASAAVKVAKHNLHATKVYAASDGVVNNLFLSPGSPVKAYEPLFAFVDTSTWWVQANFKETNLSGVHVGQKATIRLRMYLGEKVYHGVVVSTNWAVGRNETNPNNNLQSVPSENQWLLLPQRFPVLIRIDNIDPHYPLHMGASAYVSLD